MAPIAINSSNFHFPSSNIIPSNNNIPHTYIQISDPKKAESSSVFDRQQNPRQIELTNSQTLKTLTREIGTQTDITCRLISDNRFPLPRAFQAIACLSNIVEEINKSQYDSPNHQQGGEYPDESPSTTTRSENYERMREENLSGLSQDERYC